MAPVSAYDGDTYRLLIDLAGLLEASVAYVDRLTVEAHLERSLSDPEWSAITSRSTALAFDEHIGNAGTIRTDWMTTYCSKPASRSDPRQQPPAALTPASALAMRTTQTCSSCGHTADYASAPLADTHHSRHSCVKHLLALERAARRVDRARTRATRECTHAGPQHVHGTRAAYIKDRCRCTACTAANTAASRAANRERAYGRRQPLTDAGPVHDHLVALRAAGIGVQRIAGLTGMSVSFIRTLAASNRDHSPATRRIRPSTAARILSITISDAHRAPHSRVDATGTRRRLQALVAIGWPPRYWRTSSLAARAACAAA